MGAVDIYVAYRFIKGLTLRWTSWEAYKEGVIDKDGKVILEPKERSKKQKNSYGAFNRLIASVKRVFDKVPFVRSKVGSFAAALWLLKEEAKKNGASELDLEALFMEQVFNDKFTLEDIKEDVQCTTIPRGKYHIVDDITETNEILDLKEDVCSFIDELGVPLYHIHNSNGETITISYSNIERV